MKNVVISGGTGLVGRHLSKNLRQKGYEVFLLTRNKELAKSNNHYLYWNLEDVNIDIDIPTSIYIDHVVHLVGANIGERRWTKKRKAELLESRLKSGNMMFEQLKNRTPESVTTVSAIGYYGAVTSDHVFKEEDPHHPDFLGVLCDQWESVNSKLGSIANRHINLRLGVVLAQNGGILSKIAPLFRLGLGSSIGSGKQYMPWIHIDDVVEVIINSIEGKLKGGTYNCVSPEHLTNDQFSKELATCLGKTFELPNVPAFVFKLAYGEMSKLLLFGSRVSADKIINAGFNFKYPSIKKALDQVYNNS